MTRIETLHPELSADLVERVVNLSPEAMESLKLIWKSERTATLEDRREFSDEIRRRLDTYDRGELHAVDGDAVVARLRETIRKLKAGAKP